MSWFKHRPKTKEAPKHLPHKSMGPIARNLWNQTKDSSKSKQEENEKPKES